MGCYNRGLIDDDGFLKFNIAAAIFPFSTNTSICNKTAVFAFTTTVREK